MSAYQKIKSVNTHEIKIGDLIQNHGVIFRITKENNRKADEYGVTINFATEVVADESNGHFPKSWQNDFSIQGNKNAHWNLVEPKFPEPDFNSPIQAGTEIGQFSGTAEQFQALITE